MNRGRNTVHNGRSPKKRSRWRICASSMAFESAATFGQNVVVGIDRVAHHAGTETAVGDGLDRRHGDSLVGRLGRFFATAGLIDGLTAGRAAAAECPPVLGARRHQIQLAAAE